MSSSSLSSLIWSVADLLRGDYKPAEYGGVILPFTVLRRLDCVLAPTKDAVLKEHAAREGSGVNPELFLLRKANQPFYNASPLDLPKLLGDPDHIGANMEAYIAAFPPVVRDIFERFGFDVQIERLRKAKLLYKVTERFADFDLSPARVTNHDMGLVFEELIHKFADLSNETAGEHFTPRDAIELMVNLLFIEDDEILTPGNRVVRTLYDCTAGTGGMLSTGEEFVVGYNSQATIVLYGQELNDESYAICKADMLIKGQDVRNIVPGNALSEDGQMLFLLNLVAKMRPAQEGGSRIGIVLNGSPLFTGGAGSGASEIRRYLLENDLVEAIVALPTDMFFNTGISTYVWVLTNRKPQARRGLVQMIDASALWEKMRRSLGSKRRRMGADHIAIVTRPVQRLPAGSAGDADGRRRPHDADGGDGGGGAAGRAPGRQGQASASVAAVPHRGVRLSQRHRGAALAQCERAARAGAEGQGERQAGAGPGTARHGERAAGGGRRRLCGVRGAAARAGRLGGRDADPGRLRHPVHAAFLRV